MAKDGDRRIATIKGNLFRELTNPMGEYVSPRQYAMWTILGDTLYPMYPMQVSTREANKMCQEIGRN